MAVLGPGHDVGAAVGEQSVLQRPTVTLSYGFGEVTNEETAAGNSTKPAGVTAATGLTAANTAQCSNPTYTTETVCTATTLTVAAGSWDTTSSACSAPETGATAGIDYTTYTTEAVCDAPSPAAKAAGTWDASSSTCSAPMTGATTGVTYSEFTTQASCTSTSQKLVETWSSWSNAADNTLNAWVFGTGVAPKLRYADYDGTGSSTTVLPAALFPSTVTCSAAGDRAPRAIDAVAPRGGCSLGLLFDTPRARDILLEYGIVSTNKSPTTGTRRPRTPIHHPRYFAPRSLYTRALSSNRAVQSTLGE